MTTNKINIFVAAILLFACNICRAQSTQTCHECENHETANKDSIDNDKTLDEISVVKRRSGVSRMAGAENGIRINREELFKAACCNLGESFTTNPSVDVSYNDATTGAKQIKLLGLAGTYVQMLSENIPTFIGAASPYALGYVPGTWMNGIQVSKGASSVKYGYNSITGQINVDYKKPEDKESIEVNVFGDTKSRMEANADANIHLNDKLSTIVMIHYENVLKNHDDNNDGFLDKPRITQYNVGNRWKYQSGDYIFHGGIGAIKELRKSGQINHNVNVSDVPFRIRLETDRYEAYAKNAYVFDHDKGSNIALLVSGSMHQLDAGYGHKLYDVNEKNLYASLVYETNISDIHNISAGISFNHDYLGQSYRTVNDKDANILKQNDKETVPGIYAQYTLNLNRSFSAIAGIRADHSSLYGTFYTPRFHLKYMPSDIITMRVSAGKGYRTVHALAENNYLLASGRNLVIDNLKQEAAWNYGASIALLIPLWDETLKINADYYYTRFSEQAVIDYDSDPMSIYISNLNGKSYSNTFQIDASYVFFKNLTLTAAYRLNDVKTTYGGKLLERPLTSKYKGLFTASYKTPKGEWQFDATLQMNGGGRLPEPYEKLDGSMSWNKRFSSYEQLSAQITRWFNKWSVYIGGENLTDFTQKTSIYNGDNAWSKEFEPTMIWGPVHGRMFYAGIRVSL